MNKKQEKKIIELAKKFHLRYIYLFGSQARGNIKPLSDYDFAVKFNNRKKNHLKERLRLMSALTDILQEEKIDVIDIEDADLLLNFNIIKDGKMLYAKNKAEQVFDKFRVMQKYLDRQYYIDRHFKAALKTL